jgi:hypothetical protein
MNKISDYYLVMEKVIDLPSPKRNMILDMYRDMLHRIGDPQCKELVSSYFNTLEVSGYIKNRTIEERQEKLNELTHEES